MNEKAKEALNKATNICLFVKENSGDEQTARYMSEAIAAVNEAVSSSNVPGNAAALRAALENLLDDAERGYEIGDAPVAGAPGERQTYHVVDAEYIIDTARAALAAPARNCDVGTPEEQYKRFKKFCFDNMGDGMNEPRCSKCPLGRSKASCKFDWEQMPYAPDEGETK